MNRLISAALPSFSFLSFLIKKPMLLLASAVVVPVVVVSLRDVVEILILLFVADMGTGMWASYCDWKRATPKGKYFFRAVDKDNEVPDEQRGFSSDKFKKSFIKGIVYGGFPLVILRFQQAFLIKNFKIPTYISDSEINLTTALILIFCANELFSIFWENLPKCGLNLPKGIRNLIVGVKDIAKERDN